MASATSDSPKASFHPPSELNDKQEGDVDLAMDASALVYIMLWTAVEALDQNWSPPKDWTPEA